MTNTIDTLRTLAASIRTSALAGDYAAALALTNELRAVPHAHLLSSDPWAILMALTHRDLSPVGMANALESLPAALRMLDRAIDFLAEDLARASA
jgi:hypothetical protein